MSIKMRDLLEGKFKDVLSGDSIMKKIAEICKKSADKKELRLNLEKEFEVRYNRVGPTTWNYRCQTSNGVYLVGGINSLNEPDINIEQWGIRKL